MNSLAENPDGPDPWNHDPSSQGCKTRPPAGSDEKPDRLRWFHGGSDGQDPLCCKLAWTSMLSWVGMGYGRQPTPGLCQEETRLVPSEACCRLPDSGDRGLYVSKVTMVLRVNATSATKRTFLKSTPEFQITDIHAGKDYDDSRVDGLSDVHAFVLKWFGKGQGKCSGPWDRLVQDTTRSCLLRHAPEQDCCCEEAAVKEEKRCLPTGVTGLEGSVFWSARPKGPAKKAVAMPPRRPGGKYKGLVTRNKSDAALAKEASERAKKQQEEMVKRAAMRKQKELMDRNGLGTELVDPEEEKRQRILNLMMGGRKGDIAKFFQAWRKGATQQRKETKIREREIGWRANCGGTDPDIPGGCSSVKLLMPANMALPLNNFLNITSGESETFRTSRGRDYSMGLTGMSDKLKQATVTRATGLLPKIKDAQTREVSVEKHVHHDTWFGPKSEVQTVSHCKTGELYYLDTMTMRIRQCPVERQMQNFRRRSAVLDLNA
eukprot:s921_g11.t2